MTVQSSDDVRTSASAVALLAPYIESSGWRAASEETQTNRVMPADWAAARIWAVPVTFPLSKPATSGALTTPATCKTASAPLHNSPRLAVSFKLPCTQVTPAFLCWSRRVSARTCQPAAINRSNVIRPTKPVAPVSATVFTKGPTDRGAQGRSGARCPRFRPTHLNDGRKCVRHRRHHIRKGRARPQRRHHH